MCTTRPIGALTTVVCTVLMCGCASIVSKSQYPVTITSQPSGASISVVDETGKTILKGTTPTTVTLAAGAGFFKGKDYTVTFTKPGYTQHTATLRRGLDAWYILGNIVFGGLIGWLVVDPITGAMWTLPDDGTATLSSQSSMIEANDAVNIVSLDQVPDELRGQMVRLRYHVHPTGP